MSTILSKSIAILFGIVFFASGVSFAIAALDPIGGSQGSLLDPTATPSFGGQGSLLDPTTSGGQTSRPINLGGTVTTPISTTGSQLVNTDPATTAVMANAVTTNTQAQTAVASAQAAYDAAVASGNETQILATEATLKSVQAMLASISGVSAVPANVNSANNTGEFLIKALTCTGIVSCIMWLPTVGPVLVFYAFYQIASFLLMLAGMLFDFSLFLSITKSFVDQPFIDSLWKIMRDFSNMLFIFILLYTGISTMLGMGNWKRTVVQVVIVALLINFSLFFTKVVIDAGNILAVGVYEAMDPGTPSGKKRSISESLTGAFEPQNFTGKAAAGSAPEALMVFAVAVIVNLAVAWAFFTTALVFLGRLLAFWFLMIISPFAFISTALPKGNIFGWWSSTLINQSFLAPIFLFAMYIIMQVVTDKNGILSVLSAGSSGTSASISAKLIIPVLVATLLVIAIIKVKGLAKKLSGEFGDVGAKLAGGVLAVATGGTAMLGRKVIGGAASAALKSGRLQGLAQSENKFVRGFAKGGVLTANMAQKGSWDARNIGGKGPIGSLVGKGVGSLGLGKGTGEGGYQKAKGAADKKADEKARERADLFDIPQGEKDRIKREAEAKIKEAEEKATKAQKAAEESVTGQQAKVAEEAVKATQKVAEEAVKKIDEAQKAYDAGYTGSGNTQDLKLAQDLHDAKESAKVSANQLSLNEAALVAATAKHAASQAAVDLELATKAVAVAKRTGQKEIDDMTAESARRREVSAKQAESRGRHDTAKKIRASEKIGEKSIDDRIKEEVEKKLKEQGATEKEAGAH